MVIGCGGGGGLASHGTSAGAAGGGALGTIASRPGAGTAPIAFLCGDCISFISFRKIL